VIGQRGEHGAAAEAALFEHCFEGSQSQAEGSGFEISRAKGIGLTLQLLDRVPALLAGGVEQGAVELRGEIGAAGNNAGPTAFEAEEELGAVADEDGETVAATGEAEKIDDAGGVAGGLFEGDDVFVAAQTVDRGEGNRLVRGGWDVVENERKRKIVSKADKVGFDLLVGEGIVAGNMGDKDVGADLSVGFGGFEGFLKAVGGDAGVNGGLFVGGANGELDETPFFGGVN